MTIACLPQVHAVKLQNLMTGGVYGTSITLSAWYLLHTNYPHKIPSPEECLAYKLWGIKYTLPEKTVIPADEESSEIDNYDLTNHKE